MITFKELEEQLDEAHKVGDKVLIHKGPADVKGKEGRVSEIRKGLYKGAPKTYTVDYDHHETTGDRKSIQLKPTHFKAVKEDLDEAVGHTIEAHGIKGTKGTPWRKTFKSHEHLHAWADKNDSVTIHATRELEGAKKKTNEEAELDEARMTAAMKLQQAFQREQEKTARERKAGEDLLKKKEEPKKTNEAVVAFTKKKVDAPREIEKHDVENAWALKHVAAKTDKISYQHNGVTLHHANGDHTFILGGHKPLFDKEPNGKLKFKDDLGAARRAFKMPTQKAKSSNVVSLKKEQTELDEEVACNNVGSGAIAGTQGDAGKKSVVTKKPMKRQTFKEFSEECDCWTGYKRKPGTKPCAKGSCVKEEAQLDEEHGYWVHREKDTKQYHNSVSSIRKAKHPANLKVTDNKHKNLGTVADVLRNQTLYKTEEVELDEAAIDAKGHKSSTGGLTQKGVDAYRRENPGSKLQTAVTTKPSKLKPGSKDANRRKSFCARMSGVDGPMKDENGKPTRKALALRKWNC